MKTKGYTFLSETMCKEIEPGRKFYLNCCKGIFLALREQNILTRADYERCIKSAEEKLGQKRSKGGKCID